jgi:hypothetical protein
MGEERLIGLKERLARPITATERGTAVEPLCGRQADRKARCDALVYCTNTPVDPSPRSLSLRFG